MAANFTRREFGTMAAAAALVAARQGRAEAPMTTNQERFKAIVERGFSRGDLTVAGEVCAEGLIEHQYLARIDLPGPQILKAQIEDARRGIERLTFTVEAAVEVGDTVWARGKVTGADPRSAKPVAIDVIDVCRFADGKLVEHWGVPDRFALLHQIGALPPPPK
jgi:ketosteroid isomerase-like protein